jgi:hypothetical protein
MHLMPYEIEIPYGWRLVQFDLWEDEPPADEAGTRYEVLHLSMPELRCGYAARDIYRRARRVP